MKRYIVLLIASLLTLVGCREKIAVRETNYRVVLEPDMNIQHNAPSRPPSTYRVLFYDRETHKLVSSHRLSSPGGSLYNPPAAGYYDIVVYSLGTHKTSVTLEQDRNTLIANSVTLSYMEMPIIDTPDHLFVQTFENVLVPHLVADDEPWVLRVKPKSIVESWKLCVEGIKGLENATIIDCYISGQSEGALLWDNKMLSRDVAIYFKGLISPDGGKIDTPFTTFGKLDGKDSKLTLNIVLEGSGGDTYICKDDVTEQFSKANADHIIKAHFDIVIKPRADSGFNPSAEEWNNNVTIIDLT